MSYTFLYLSEVLRSGPSYHIANLSSVSTHTHTHHPCISHKKWYSLQLYYRYRVKLLFLLFKN